MNASHPTKPNRLALLTLAMTSFLTLCGQSPAPPCFYLEEFSNAIVPADWNIGVPVEQQDANGAGLGTFVDAWRIGTADSANSNGYFNVPDVPFGNSFLMANDDATPCNCDLDSIVLTGPSLDLTSRVGTVMEYRVFHEGGFGAGDPILEVSDNGGLNWTALETIPPVPGQWQQRIVDLSTFDGASDVSVRFTWSDSGNWAAGIALDDICFSERFAKDLTLADLFIADITQSAFDPSVRSMEYTTIPLSQVEELVIGAELQNRGTDTLRNVIATITVTAGGGIHATTPIGTLAPGDGQRVFVNTAWTPTSSGQVQLNATSSHDDIDDDPSDDNRSESFLVTGPGATNGFSTMGVDDGIQDFSLSNDSNEFGAGVLLEMKGSGDFLYGIGVLLDASTAPGTPIQAVLLDGSLQLLDTSNTVTIDPSHISQSAMGNFMYLPLTTPFILDQDRDVYAMIYAREEESSFLTIQTSGSGPVGHSLFFDGVDDTWDFPLVTPMVRAFLDDPSVVGIDEPKNDKDLLVYPSPADGHVFLTVQMGDLADLRWEVHDIMGRLVFQRQGSSATEVNTSDWEPGAYIVSLTGAEVRSSARFIVSH